LLADKCSTGKLRAIFQLQTRNKGGAAWQKRALVAGVPHLHSKQNVLIAAAQFAISHFVLLFFSGAWQIQLHFASLRLKTVLLCEPQYIRQASKNYHN